MSRRSTTTCCTDLAGRCLAAKHPQIRGAGIKVQVQGLCGSANGHRGDVGVVQIVNGRCRCRASGPLRQIEASSRIGDSSFQPVWDLFTELQIRLLDGQRSNEVVVWVANCDRPSACLFGGGGQGPNCLGRGWPNPSRQRRGREGYSGLPARAVGLLPCLIDALPVPNWAASLTGMPTCALKGEQTAVAARRAATKAGLKKAAICFAKEAVDV